MKLKENQHIHLVVKNGQRKGTYDSRVEAIHDSAIVVGMPIGSHTLIYLKEGTKIEVRYTYGKVAYGFVTEVERALTDPLPLLFLKIPKEIFKIQRRNYVRIETLLKVEYIVEDNTKDEEKSPIETVTRDISAGGLAIVENKILPINSILCLFVHLPKQILELQGKVVRWGEITNTPGKKYWMGVEFINISESQRQVIIRYIFGLQRELRARGLL